MKVMTIVGTRPELIKLSRVIARLDIAFEHILVHTGQNYDYELNRVFFEDLEIRKPDFFLETAGGSAIETIAAVLMETDKLLDLEKPDAVLILGDTNSCLSAIAAKKRKIPIFHMEAGNRCFDQRVPEEVNRRIVDHISDINMPYSDIAREYLLREGFPPEQIIKTGSPMYEVLHHYRPKIDKSHILEKMNLVESQYFVLSCHREENVDSQERLVSVSAIMTKLAHEYGYPIIFSAHPRTRKRLESFGIKMDPRVIIIKPLGFFDYIKLQEKSFCVISDSGTLTEEAAILGFDAINLREAHERPEGMEEAVTIMTGISVDRVAEALKLLGNSVGIDKKHTIVSDYDVESVSDKIARIILSYRDYIMRRVWYVSGS